MRDEEPIKRLRDVFDLQPEDRRAPPPKPTLGDWFRNNWIYFGMFLIAMSGQLWNGTGWLHARENEGAQIERLSKQLEHVPDTYVTKEMLQQVLMEIRGRLASIDNRLAAERR